MTPQQFLLIIFARRHLALVAFVLTAVAGVAVTLTMPKVYTATTSLVVEVKTDPIAGALMPAVGSPSYMATQTEILESERVAIGLVKLLRIDQNPQLVERWKADGDGKTPLDNYYAKLLRKGLAVSPMRGSNVITLSYSGRDPKFATAIANAFAQAYIDLTIDLRVEPARQYAAWFDERLKTLRGNLEKAQAKLSAYQRDKGIVATDERVDQEMQRLNSFSAQLAAIQGEKVELSSRQKNSGNELSPDVLQNPLIQGLKSELSKAETKLSEISSNIGNNHPLRLQLEGQISGLKQQLDKEMHRISGGAATANRTSALKEQELKAAVDAQKQKVLALRAERDEISVLSKDVETAQRIYESVSQRVGQLTLESQTNQANVLVLSPAIEPSEPSQPNIPKFLLGTLLASVAAAFAAALGAESLDRRIRTVTDIAVDGVPVLGVMTPRKRKYSLRERLALALSFIFSRRRRRSGVAVAGATAAAAGL